MYPLLDWYSVKTLRHIFLFPDTNVKESAAKDNRYGHQKENFESSKKVLLQLTQYDIHACLSNI